MLDNTLKARRALKTLDNPNLAWIIRYYLTQGQSLPGLDDSYHRLLMKQGKKLYRKRIKALFVITTSNKNSL